MGILAQILENLTNLYFGPDFANCTNFMWSKTSLKEGPISQKLQKFKHHDFIFKVSTPPPLHKLLHMGHNVVKNIFRRGSHITKIARKCTFYFSQALIPRAFYTAHLVLLRIWRVLCYACTNFMWSKTSLEEGPISQKLQKFKHHDFIFKVSTLPPPHKLFHMGHNVVKNILRRGSHFTKIARKYTFYFSQALIPRIIMHIQHPLGNTERFSTKEKWNDVSK